MVGVGGIGHERIAANVCAQRGGGLKNLAAIRGNLVAPESPREEHAR